VIISEIFGSENFGPNFVRIRISVLPSHRRCLPTGELSPRIFYCVWGGYLQSTLLKRTVLVAGALTAIVLTARWIHTLCLSVT